MNTESANTTQTGKKFSFTDTEGRTWTLSLNAWSIAKVRDELEINLLDIGDGRLFARLMADPLFMADVAWCICEDEAQKLGVDARSFQSALSGNSIEDATTVMVDSIVAFTPNEGDRARLALVVEKTRKMMDDERDSIQKSIDNGMLDEIVSVARDRQTVSQSQPNGPVFAS